MNRSEMALHTHNRIWDAYIPSLIPQLASNDNHYQLAIKSCAMMAEALFRAIDKLPYDEAIRILDIITEHAEDKLIDRLS